MLGDPMRSDRCADLMRPDAVQAREYLMAALRAARSDALRAGAEPDAVTADLKERLRRVRRMLAADQDEFPPGEE